MTENLDRHTQIRHTPWQSVSHTNTTHRNTCKGDAFMLSCVFCSAFVFVAPYLVISKSRCVCFIKMLNKMLSCCEELPDVTPTTINIYCFSVCSFIYWFPFHCNALKSVQNQSKSVISVFHKLIVFMPEVKKNVLVLKDNNSSQLGADQKNSLA